ncbi:hypothetical protein [Halorhabdus rudnickae]|uniref:hypothetical protein n=1 Tax=Halorhabdus rudnickae TaxID=1775544 RepID=UPI00108238F0|nr:hypothetical protein [Halorhabdus rudnickae]
MPIRDRPRSIWLLGLLLGQLSVRACIGGIALLAAPSGSLVGLSTAPLQNTPLGDFFLPGLALLLAFGVVPAIVCYGIYANRGWAWSGALLVALALFIWIGLEVGIGFTRPTVFLNLGTALAIVGVAAYPAVRHDLRTGPA